MSHQYEGPNGSTYSLSHLAPFSLVTEVTIDGLARAMTIDIVFSTHCYTDHRRNTVLIDDPWFFCTDSTGNRAFCPTRWKQSLTLPDLVRRLIQERKVCYMLNSSSNLCRVETTSKNNKFEGWYLMFDFSRAKPPSSADVRVSIKSYHHRRSSPGNFRAAPRRFHALLAEWFSKKT